MNGSTDTSQNESNSPVTVMHDIVHFTDDAGVVDTNTLHHVIEDLSSLSVINHDLSIISFLKRPKIYRSGRLSSTDTYGVIGGVAFPLVNVPSSLLSNTMVLDKLKGVMGIRSTLVITVVVNATRFTQGVYGLFHVPSGGAAIAYHNSVRNAYVHTYHTRSMLPHVRLDLSCDTKATLSIPYTGAYNYLDLTNASTSAGTVTGDSGSIVFAPLTPFSQLSPALGEAYYTIYWHMEDVTLYGAGLVAQSDIAIGEAKSKGAGPLETTSKAISYVAGKFSRVPTLSSFASTVKWASDIVSGVASAHGWSRPTNLQAAVRVKRKPLAYFSNVDELDSADALGLSVKSSLQHTQFSGTDVDELDIVNFCSRFCLIGDVEWADTAAQGFLLADYPLSVNHLPVSGGIVQYTPLSYMGSMFQYWRGGIKFKFTVVRTEFHSGRLQFSFSPNSFSDSHTVGYAFSDYFYREIIDIREKSIFEIVVPFLQNTSYLPVGRDFGRLDIHVVDELIAPSTVSSSVRILVEVSGCDDIEFSVPRFINRTPVFDLSPQMDCMISSNVIAGDRKPVFSVVPSKMCIGERVVSLRSMLKKFTSSSTVGSISIPGSNSFLLRPRLIEWCSSLSNSTSQSQTADLYSYVSCCFASSRGGIRIKYINPAPVSRVLVAESTSATRRQLGVVSLLTPTSNAFGVKFIGVPGIDVARDRIARTNVVYFNPIEEYGAEVEIPAYQFGLTVPTQELRVASPGRDWPASFIEHICAYLPQLRIQDPSLDTYDLTSVDGQRPFVARAGSEDFELGGFISIPPMRNFQEIDP